MKWSWKIVRFAGIDVFIHATFPFLIVWIAYAYYSLEQSIEAAVSGVIFVLALFVCVVLHEFGHALTARRYGIATKNITLLPIGGVASLEKLPDDPKQEIAVALAGPAVNVAIAVLIYLWFLASNTPIDAEQISPEQGFSLQALMAVNITLAVFNMIPAFPMDGGRVFRATLALSMDRARATRIAATAGQVFALFLGALGVMFNPFLILIALFIWMGATSESGIENLKTLLAGRTVGDAMLSEFHTVSPEDSLDRATQYTLAGTQTDFPVVENGKLVGVLTQTELLKGLQEQGGSGPVGPYARTNTMSCEHDEPLEAGFEKLIGKKGKLLAVTDKGRLIGILDLQNILEMISFRSALEARYQTGTPWIRNTDR